MLSSFKRLFKDNNRYRDYDELPYVDSLAYAVQEILYTDKVKDNRFDFRLDGRIRLYDFMTLAVSFIVPSLSEFGKSTINDYINILKTRKNQFQQRTTVEYPQEEALLVTHASSELILDILWAARVYTLIRSYSGEKKWFDASTMFYLMMIEERKETYAFHYPLFDTFDEACRLMEEHIQKNPYKRGIKINIMTEEPVLIHDDGNETLRAQIEELKAENTELKEIIKQKEKELEEKHNQFPLEQSTASVDEMAIELLTPLFKDKEEDSAKSFYEELNGKDDIGVTEVVMSHKEDFSLRLRNVDLWRILHAAKKYSSSDRNFDTALRKGHFR